MEIVKKLKDKTKKIRIDWCAEGKGEALKAQRLAIAAVAEGMPTKGTIGSAWEAYMKFYEPTENELKRLMGWDDEYMKNDWAKGTLVYIVANGMCTEFTHADTTRNMDEELLANIDKPFPPPAE